MVPLYALLSMEFPRQEYWSGLLFPPPGDLPDPGIEVMSPALTDRFSTTVPPGKPYRMAMVIIFVSFRVSLARENTNCMSAKCSVNSPKGKQDEL